MLQSSLYLGIVTQIIRIISQNTSNINQYPLKYEDKCFKIIDRMKLELLVERLKEPKVRNCRELAEFLVNNAQEIGREGFDYGAFHLQQRIEEWMIIDKRNNLWVLFPGPHTVYDFRSSEIKEYDHDSPLSSYHYAGGTEVKPGCTLERGRVFPLVGLNLTPDETHIEFAATRIRSLEHGVRAPVSVLPIIGSRQLIK